MKKLFVMLMALAVLGVQAGAQTPLDEAAAVGAGVAATAGAGVAAAVGAGVKAAQNAKKINVDSHVEKTVAAGPRFRNEADVKSFRQEAAKTFKAYFTANPDGEVQAAAYAPLAGLLATAQELNALIARTPNAGQREDYAIQFFFSQDIPGQYAALKAINPQLAAATNELMRSFMGTVSNGTFYGGSDHPDMQAMRTFNADIGYRY